ncbi:hypothetical protein Syun_011295 [Stephania yunnanensis]|uniref:Molybdate transporter 1 n=1 Tax=Stephania yunnanensis TaxID=152371 RepID=A0AAP0PI14_9MAGN
MGSQNHGGEVATTNSSETGVNRAAPLAEKLSNMFGKVRSNLALQSKWSELNGAMGDLGTYIPIVMALTLAKDLNLGTTLIFSGMYNIVTGAIYGVPMPVQPMKSIAAVAISNSSFNVPEIMAAGICTAGTLLVLGLTGLMEFVYKLIPLSLVRGVQLSQGLAFAFSAVKYVRQVQDFSKGKTNGDRPWIGLDGLVLAIICACFIVVVNGAGEEISEDHEDVIPSASLPSDQSNSIGMTRSTRKHKQLYWRIFVTLPSAFIVFILGVILAFIRQPSIAKQIKFGPSNIQVMKITRHEWKEGFIKGAIPQIPLSVLNSVIAVCKLSADLFPEKAKSFSATSVSTSVGLMNLVGCWFGAMPCCHGAGGLAGQYKFGGRSGGCVAMLGLVKMVLGVVIGSSIVKVLVQFPVGLLGVLLLFAGVELAMASRDMRSKEESFVMLACTSVSLVGSSAALGFACGMVVHLLLQMRKLCRKKLV